MYSSLDFTKLDASFWDQFERSACLPDGCSCEAIGNGFFLQPYSVATSIPSLLLGLYIIYKFRWRIKALGLSFFLTGFGSVLLHGSYTKIGQIADFSGIAVIFSWLLLHISINQKNNKLFFFKYTVFVIGLYFLLYNFISIRYYVIFAIVILITIMSVIKKPGLFFNHKKVSFFAIFTLAIGFVLFRLDLNRVFCPEFPLLQGHTLWHILVFVSELLILRNLYLEEVHLEKVS